MGPGRQVPRDDGFPTASGLAHRLCQCWANQSALKHVLGRPYSDASDMGGQFRSAWGCEQSIWIDSRPRQAARHTTPCLASIMRQCQVSAVFRSLTCQSRTSVPTCSRRSTLPATQTVRKRALLALGATHAGGLPPTSAQGRSSKPDATFHPARWAAQAAKRISRDPPRLPRDRHRPILLENSVCCPLDASEGRDELIVAHL